MEINNVSYTKKSFWKNDLVKRSIIFLAAVAVMFLVLKLPSPPDLKKGSELISLSAEGKAVVAVLLYAVVLWMTEAVPFAVTSLSMIVILTLLKIDTFPNIVNLGLGNEVILFLMGAMGISGMLTNSGLANRIMLIVLSRVGTGTKKIVFAFMAIGVVVSMWVTDMAVAAMLLPLGITILQSAGRKPLESNFGRALMIGIVWGCLIGGTGTPAGAGPNILVMGYIKDMAGLTVTFPQWMAVGVPGALLMLPLGWLLLIKMFPPEIDNLPVPTESIRQDLKNLGPLSKAERHTLCIFALTVTLWLAGPTLRDRFGFALSDAGIAMLGFLLGFLPMIRVFDNWKSAAKEIDWGGLMLIAGGIAAGMLLSKTGGARYLAWALLSGIGNLHPILRVMAVIAVVELMKVFFSSNSVTGAVVIPLLISIASDLQLSAWGIAGPAGIATSLALIMVTSSPTNVIPYSSGYFSIKDFAKCGVPMTVIAILCVTASVVVFGKLAGINIW